MTNFIKFFRENVNYDNIKCNKETGFRRFFGRIAIGRRAVKLTPKAFLEINETNLNPQTICFFFILREGESKTEEYPGNEDEVKQKKNEPKLSFLT